MRNAFHPFSSGKSLNGCPLKKMRAVRNILLPPIWFRAAKGPRSSIRQVLPTNGRGKPALRQVGRNF